MNIIIIVCLLLLICLYILPTKCGQVMSHLACDSFIDTIMRCRVVSYVSLHQLQAINDL